MARARQTCAFSTRFTARFCTTVSRPDIGSNCTGGLPRARRLPMANGEIAAELADHYSRANDKSKAVKSFQLAGEQAVAKGADNAAIEQLGAALELVAKLPDDQTSRLQEMRLRILIGPSLTAVKGLGSSETAANYTRALELCQLAGDTSALFEALSGLWTFHLVRAELREAEALAQQLLASACESKDGPHLAF